MGDKKRKADSQSSERPAKKAQTGTIKVTHLSGPDVAKPVVAFSPGVILPSDLSFHAFSRKGKPGTSDLLLQSSAHPTIDYVATESSTTDAGEKHLKHYVAVFDPATNKLKVMEAKKMTVRSSVRQPELEDTDEEADERIKPPATPSSRAALTQAFGTKKSKRAVASVAENRLLARDGEKADNPISNAILSSIDDEDDQTVTLDSGVSSRINKPLPQANLDTTEISQVYDLSSLVFPEPARTTLSQMPLNHWLDSLKKGKPLSSRSRFVANRVAYVARLWFKDPKHEDLLLKMQVLRYIQLLEEIYTYITRLPSRKPIPAPDKWPRATISDTSLSTTFKSTVISHFFPDNTPTPFSKALLTTTILALTLHVPPPKFTPGATPSVLAVETTDIAMDLALPYPEVHTLYRELGCKMESATEGELKGWGLDKVKHRKVMDNEGNEIKLPKPKFAKLRFPIEFPKISTGRPNRR